MKTLNSVNNARGLLKIGNNAEAVTELRVQSYNQRTGAQLEINVEDLTSFDQLVVDGSVSL